MRKGIFVVCVAVLVLAMVMAAAAKVETPKKGESLNGGGKDDNKGGGGKDDDKDSHSQGQPFLEIWKAIKDLQDKLNSGVTRAEFDALKTRVDVLEGRVDALEARVAFLEQCVPVSETCNGMDDDCDGVVDDGPNLCDGGQSCTSGVCVEQCDDIDSDGVTTCNGDCNDNNPAIHPGAPEVCDGVDNDCNAMTDEGGNDWCGSGFVCNNGQCTTDVCTPNPCTTPPGPTCSDSDSFMTYDTGIGVCTSTGVGYTCDYGIPTITDCAADQVCENGNCKISCAGIFQCIAINECTSLDPSCEANCVAQGSTVGLQDYNAFTNCPNVCNNDPNPMCIPNCEALYTSCSG